MLKIGWIVKKHQRKTLKFLIFLLLLPHLHAESVSKVVFCYLHIWKRFLAVVGNRDEDNHIWKRRLSRALFSDHWKRRKLFKILSRNMAMIDAHGYDYSHILIVDYRLWDFISEILSYNEVYCIFISAWGLELLVLTRWAIPTASVVERVMDIAPRLFCYGKHINHLFPIAKSGVYRH